ncbi:MAG TPA: hypothetical protein ENG33_08510 [Chloroflexi bacterium]|nr:hypothetical protein [Chloroflexota bacterium]
MRFKPPRHIAWSVDTVDLADPFQREWYIRQVLLYGRTEDIRKLDLDELSRILDKLNLPSHIYDLWRAFLEQRKNT